MARRSGYGYTFRDAPGDWAADAACRDADPGAMEYDDTFTTRNGTRAAERKLARARLLCAGCPVFADCEQWALGSPDPAIGHVAAGMTAAERGEVRRRRSGMTVT